MVEKTVQNLEEGERSRTMGFILVLICILLFNAFLDTGISLDEKTIGILYVVSEKEGSSEVMDKSTASEGIKDTPRKRRVKKKTSTTMETSDKDVNDIGDEEFLNSITDKDSAEDLLESIYGGRS